MSEYVFHVQQKGINSRVKRKGKKNMLQLPDTGMCVNFESPSSVASAQLITLNMEACIPPEPANLSDNA